MMACKPTLDLCMYVLLHQGRTGAVQRLSCGLQVVLPTRMCVKRCVLSYAGLFAGAGPASPKGKKKRDGKKGTDAKAGAGSSKQDEKPAAAEKSKKEQKKPAAPKVSYVLL